MKENIFYKEFTERSQKAETFTDLFGAFIGAANAAMAAAVSEAEKPAEQTESPVQEPAAPVKTKPDNVFMVAHVVGYDYVGNEEKADEFIKSKLDDRVFTINANVDIRINNGDAISERFEFSDGETYVFDWDWEKDAFVLNKPDKEGVIRYDIYKREFVEENEVASEETKCSARPNEALESATFKTLQDCGRDEIAENLQKLAQIRRSARNARIVSEDEFFDAIESLLREGKELDLIVEKGENVGICLTTSEILVRVSDFFCDNNAEANFEFIPYSEEFLKKLAKTFRFREVVYSTDCDEFYFNF